MSSKKTKDLKESKDPQETEELDYEIGFKKPPKEGRFVKGRSGNPKGRPKGCKNFATIFRKVIFELVTVVQNGKKRQITKLEAGLTNVSNKAANGDMVAVKLIAQLMPMAQAQLAEQNPSTSSDEQDLLVIAQMLKKSNEG